MPSRGTASKMLEKSLGSSDFPSADCSDGGYGAVAALVGSYMADLGCLVPGCLDYHKLMFH